MIQYKRGQASKKELSIINDILENFIDTYSDFYITRKNLRLFIKENKDLLFDCIKKGDKIIYAEEKGIIFITGYSDKADRKYIKILAKDEESADYLIKVMGWHTEKEKLFAKVKKNNPIRRVLQRNNFTFCGDRGKEILLVRDTNFFDIKVEEKEKIKGE